MIPNQLGRVVINCWNDIPNHFPFVKLDAFTLMPNHVHGVLFVGDGTDGGIGGCIMDGGVDCGCGVFMDGGVGGGVVDGGVDCGCGGFMDSGAVETKNLWECIINCVW